MSDQDDPSLGAAYALETPQDSVRLYRQWASDYDSGFVTDSGYELHLHVAHAFAQAGGLGPVLDVGAGTGLCGAALRGMGIGPVDGIDISAEMLAQARTKDAYRALFTADLYAGRPTPAGAYGGLVSSGTFTNGHVGPEVLPDLIEVLRPGGLAALSVNAQHYEAKGFAAMLEGLSASQITGLTLQTTRIYAPGAEGEHADDLAFVVVFERATG